MKNDDRLTVSVNEAVRLTSISRSTMYTYLNSGLIESVMVGGRRLVKMDSLKKVLA